MIKETVAELLACGVREHKKSLRKLPIRLINTDTGRDALETLKQAGLVDGIIARWDIPDMPDGELLELIKERRPWIPTLVLLDNPEEHREIKVRSLGITAVLPADIDSNVLYRTVSQLIGLEYELAPVNTGQQGQDGAYKIA